MNYPNSDITGHILGVAIEVHRILGPGLLESMYEDALVIELIERKLEVERQVHLPASYKGHPLGSSFRIDLVVEKSVIVEVKAVEHLLPVHDARVLTYLHLTNLRVGLLLNFNVSYLNQGIRRLVNAKFQG
jgi:GxxExxY protein